MVNEQQFHDRWEEAAAVPGPSQPGLPQPGPPQPMVFKLCDGIELLDRHIGKQHIVVVNDKRVGKFYHLGGHEAEVLSLMDGKMSVAAIAESLQRRSIEWSVDEVQGWATMLAKSGLVVAVDDDGKPLAGAGSSAVMPGGVGGGNSASSPWTFQRLVRPLGHVISQRIPIATADDLAISALPWLGFLLSRVAACVWAVAATVALALVWTHWHALGVELRMMFSPAALPLLAVIWVVLKAMHELGHAVAAKRKGVRVGKFGITFFLFAPIPYVDVTDAWKVPSVWSRVQIALAGVYFESWTAIVATGAYVFLPEGLGKHLAVQWMMMAGPATWLVNVNPLMRMDGYYALADAINVPNLRMHGRSFWGGIFNRVCLGVPRKPVYLQGWRLWAAATHAVASLLFQAAWMSGLVIAVMHWGGPVGLIVSLSAILLWCAAPVVMWFVTHWSAPPQPDAVHLRLRLIATMIVGLALVFLALNTSSPLRRSVPVVVQYRDEQVVRAPAAGFLTEIRVHSGQWVQRGELLLVIEDEDLVLRRDQMRDELELATSKARQLASRGELGAAEGQNEAIRALKDSLAELDESIRQLRPVAVRSGIVVSPHPERQLGRHVQKGDVLLRVADPSDKELLVVFPESEWGGYSRVFSQPGELPARLRGGIRVDVKPLPARPRFSDRLPSPSFAGSGGGDIPVIKDAQVEDGFRAAFPVGEAVAMLSPLDSKRLHSGQRGRMYLSDSRTIAQRLWLHLGGE